MVRLEQIQTRVAEAIKQSGLTQIELARCLGIGQQTISEYLRGKSMPALDTFANLCIVLDLDANDMLCVEGNRNTVVSNSFNNNSGTISIKG